jgi:hypothetical protein
MMRPQASITTSPLTSSCGQTTCHTTCLARASSAHPRGSGSPRSIHIATLETQCSSVSGLLRVLRQTAHVVWRHSYAQRSWCTHRTYNGISPTLSGDGADRRWRLVDEASCEFSPQASCHHSRVWPAFSEARLRPPRLSCLVHDTRVPSGGRPKS